MAAEPGSQRSVEEFAAHTPPGARTRHAWLTLAALAVILCGCPERSAVNVEKSSPEVAATGPTTGTAGLVEPAAGEALERFAFRNRTADSAVDFTYHNGQEAAHGSILESLGGGATLLDYDNDGLLDLFLPGGGAFGAAQEISGLPSALYRNRGDWQFAEVAALAQVQQSPYFSHSGCRGDYDNDGFVDLVLTGYGGLQLFHNQGDGTFREVRVAAGLDDTLWSSGASWGDLDQDGALDLYVCHYVNWSWDNHPLCGDIGTGRRDACPPSRFDALPHVAFRNLQDGSFENVSQEIGLRDDGKGLGAIIADLDNDGDVDIYVANDMTDNFLYVNDGRGRFTEDGMARGVAVDDQAMPNASMGLGAVDLDLDGLLDLWVTNYEGELYALYRNRGQAEFDFVSRRAGLNAWGTPYVGWGSVFYDFDRDGDEDVIVTNGHAIRRPDPSPRKQPPVVLENRHEEKRLQRLRFGPEDYLTQPHDGRGLAAGDLDNDGDADLVFSNLNEPVALLENQTEHQGAWVRVRLIGTRSARDAIGARLVLHTDTGDQTRSLSGGGSYLSPGEMQLEWGLPHDAAITGLTVHWPHGEEQRLTALPRNQVMTLIEP